jgi:hypothetical protein
MNGSKAARVQAWPPRVLLGARRCNPGYAVPLVVMAHGTADAIRLRMQGTTIKSTDFGGAP